MYRIIGVNQVEYGPITAEQLGQWIAEGRADANTRAKLEGTEEWKPLSAFPEFANLLGPTAAPAMGYTPAPGSFPPVANTQPVPNYLVQAILCTLCCCLPFGIVAIVYAAQVNGKLQAGDYDGALRSSKSAKLWCWLAFGIGIVTTGLIILLQMVAGLSGIH